MRSYLTILPAALLLLPARAGEPEQTSCGQLMAIARRAASGPTNFVLTATVLQVLDNSRRLHLEDTQGGINLSCIPDHDFRPGDRVRIVGHVVIDRFITTFFGDKFERLSHGIPPLPQSVTPDEFFSGAVDGRLVCLDGTLRSVHPDETNPDYLYFILLADDQLVYCATRNRNGIMDRLRQSVGRPLRATGVCEARLFSTRLQLGRNLQCLVSDVQFLSATTDPFEVPELEDLSHRQPSELASLGLRRLRGRLLAVRQNGQLLVRRADGTISNIERIAGALPACGEGIEAVGFPVSDFYHVNLSQARVRPCADDGLPMEPEPVGLSNQTIFRVSDGHIRVNPTLHGQLVRLRGEVRALPTDNSLQTMVLADAHGGILSVDVSQSPSILAHLVPGCQVELNAVSVLSLDDSGSHALFPVITGYTFVLRSADDLIVVSRPSWWTPARFWTLIAVLAGCIFAVLVWCLALSRLATRRARELVRREMQMVRTQLKVEERTQLSTDLHDAISQNLTGISLELRTLAMFTDQMPSDAQRHLDIARRTLGSCRRELRNVLRDLRTDALDRTTFSEALRTALQPHVGTAGLSIRFAVPRHRIADRQAHVILQIIRELVSNAVRHGEASGVKVAGTIDGRDLLFSVTDNGCGFDPRNRPGVREGHFGLTGISERIEAADGKLEIESSPGRGTHVVVRLPISTTRT